jgi:alpha-ketoglutarate-dependent 2,4-dichlorophenoxyacetate dioxygenase
VLTARSSRRTTLLLARETPPTGGNTEFADMYGAWDSLPVERQRELEGLFVVHDWTHSRAKIGYTSFTDEEKAKFPPTPQPLVRANPRTGRKHLYLASHASHIVGWPLEEGRKLVEELMEIATTPDLTGSHKWTVGDLVVWDNASTMHRATEFPDTEFRRVMARIGINEPGPVYDEAVMEQQIARM